MSWSAQNRRTATVRSTTKLSSVFAAVLLAACSGEPDEEVKSERLAKRVRIEAVEAKSLQDLLLLPATIEAHEATSLATGRSGRIDSLGADAGDRVKRGAILARINAASALAELKQAQATHASTKATFERTQSLRERNLASEATSEQAAASLAQSEAALELARANVANAVIRAPHAGYVSERHVSVGEFAAAGNPLFDIVDIDRIKVVVRVPERDIDAIRAGTEASFTVDALSDESFSGAVERVGVVADRSARTFDVELTAKNPEHRLKPGMLARVRLPRRSLLNVPVVRRDAVVEDLDGPTVFLARNGVAERVRVKLGPVEGDLVAVSDGLNVGDPLIVVGQRMLVAGEPVKPVGEPTASAADEPATDAESVAGGSVAQVEE